MSERLPVRYGSFEPLLEVKTSSERLVDLAEDEVPTQGVGLQRFAALKDDGTTDDGYMYVRVRAISSRVNKNNDGWPSDELARAYTTFLGKPIFVDHNNSDPRRTRGVVIDARLHQDTEGKTSALDPYYSTAPDNHKPPTWIELLLEVDAQTYPRLAESVRTGRVNAVSMGANIEKSKCSVCDNEADTPAQYCSHVKQKGATFEIVADTGEKIRKRAYEDCYGVGFFEISFVFDPADETADVLDKLGHKTAEFSLVEPITPDPYKQRVPQSEMITAPAEVDTLRTEGLCPNCKSGELETDPDGVRRCRVCNFVPPPESVENPDLSQSEVARDRTDGPEVAGEAEQVEIAPIESVEPVRMTRKTDASSQGIGEMKFETALRTSSLEEVEAALPVKTASRQIQLTHPEGVGFPTHLAMRQAGLSAKITYPTRGTLNASTVPGHPLRDHVLAKRAAMEQGVSSFGDLTVTIEANENVLDDVVALVQSGGKAAKPEETVISDQPKPVEAAVKESDVLSIGDKLYRLVPVESEGGEEQKVEFREQKQDGEEGDPKKAALYISRYGDLVIKSSGEEWKIADRRTIRREEQDADGVHRVEEIVEETGEVAAEAAPAAEAEASEEEYAEQPAAEEEYAYASKKTPEERVLDRLALAEFAVEVGVIPAEQKLAYVADLEGKSDEEIAAIKATLESVKTAGLSKQSRRRRDGEFTKLPRLELTQPRVAASNNGLGNLDDIPIESVYL